MSEDILAHDTTVEPVATVTIEKPVQYKDAHGELTSRERAILSNDPLTVTSTSLELIIQRIQYVEESLLQISDMLSNNDGILPTERVLELVKERETLIANLKGLMDIRDSLSPNNFGDISLHEATGDFKNYIEFANGKIRSAMPKVNLSTSNDQSTFLNVLTAATGGALQIRMILPASGFTITLSSTSNLELIPLLSRLSEIDKRLGRTTLGYTNSAATYDYIREILDVFLAPSKFISCSLNVPFDMVRQYILTSDIDLILANIGYLLNPLKFAFRHICLNTIDVTTTNPETEETVTTSKDCEYEELGQIDPRDLIFYDNSKLTVKQHEILTKPKVSVEEIQEYQQITLDNYVTKERYEFEANLAEYDDNISIGSPINGITVKLGYATIDSQFSASARYYARLDKVLNDSLAGNNPDLQDAILKDVGTILNVANYAPFIKAIILKVIDDDMVVSEKVIDNVEYIERYLLDGRNFEFKQDIFDHIQAFIDTAQIGFVGVPNSLCPRCKKPQPNEYSGCRLVPISPLRYFFSTCRMVM